MSENPTGTAGTAGTAGTGGTAGTDRDDERVRERADELWPEEHAAGSDDPDEQAQQILRESDERVEDPEGTGAESVQTSTPDQRPDVTRD